MYSDKEHDKKIQHEKMEETAMKKILTMLLLIGLVFALSTALATTKSPLPQEIADCFNNDEILDQADLTGFGSDNCWFVLVRTKSGENVLYYFKQKDGAWKEQYHTVNAVPQSRYGMNVQIAPNGQDWKTDKVFSRPRLYIAQQNDEGEYWETTVTFELTGGKWLLIGYDSHIGNRSILFANGSISYYKDYETNEITGTARGDYQRELRYVSLSSLPMTLEDARASMTFAPDLPASSELQAYPVTFTGAQKYEVYSAPDKTAVRGANGKAKVSTNSWIQVFGTEGNWVLIQYSIDTSHYRFGYISSKSLPKKASVPALQFNRTEACTGAAVSLTDDPLYSRSALLSLPEGARVVWLAALGDWAYVEVNQGSLARGFIPMKSLVFRDPSAQEHDFYVCRGQDGVMYDLFEIEKLHYDSNHHVYAVTGQFERIVSGDEVPEGEYADNGEVFTFTLAPDFHAEMIRSMTAGTMENIEVMDLYQWYIHAYMEDHAPANGELRFLADVPEADRDTAEVDFWFVTTRIELNDNNEIQYMEYEYVPWG